MRRLTLGFVVLVMFGFLSVVPGFAHFLWMQPVGSRGPLENGETFEAKVYLHAEHDDELHAWGLTLGFDDTQADGDELTFEYLTYGPTEMLYYPFDPNAWYEQKGSRKYPEADAGAIRHIGKWSLLGYGPHQDISEGEDFLLFTATFQYDGGLANGEDVWIEFIEQDGWDFLVAGGPSELDMYTDASKTVLLGDGGPDYYGTEAIPSADFSAAPTSGEKPLTVSFTDLSEGDPTQWDWDFGDGSTSTQSDPAHVYQNDGVYTVVLTVTNAFGSHSKTREALITVEGNPPVAAFSATPTTGAAPLTVQFTSQSSNDPTSWKWDLGDGKIIRQENPSHVYSMPGVYTVSLYAKNQWGNDTETKVGYITVTGAVENLVCDFSGDPTTGTAPLTVHFTDLSDGSPTEWQWDFSDSPSAITQNAPHTFEYPGTYSVTLTVSNGGDSDSKTRTGYITVTEAATPVTPVSDFTAAPLNGSAPLSVTFTDASTGVPTGWVWNFGDGSQSGSQNPTHKYTTPGTYTVGLEVTNSAGTDEKTRQNYITVTDGGGTTTAPTCAFSAAPTSGKAPLEVMFKDESTDDPTQWSWDFGDGETADYQAPSHTYTEPGTYSVQLTVSNDGGSDFKVRTDYITVIDSEQPPVPGFSATPTSGPAPLTVTFDDESTNGPTSWTWIFGDGGTGAEQNPVHVYSQPGKYTVTLTATNVYGTVTKTFTDHITVTSSAAVYPSNGIWKSADDVLSLYLQKYDTNSCIVIATMGDGAYTVFLDTDYRDGINVGQDIDGKGFSLSLAAADATGATVTASLPGFDEVIKTVELRFADVDFEDTYPRNGIWKSADGVFSLYLQKYSAGSCVVVATMGDGGYTVFLDPDYTDGISVSNDLHGRDYTFDLSAVDAGSGTVETRIPNFGTVETTVELMFDDIS